MIKTWYYSLSITQKLRLVLTLGSTIAVICFGVTYTYWGVTSLRNGLLNGTQSAADIMGSSLVASMRFNNPEFAQEKLKTLTPDASYKQVCVYKETGEVFARYPEDAQCMRQKTLWNGTFADNTQQSGGNLVVTKGVLADGQTVGAIQIVRTEEAIQKYLETQGKAMAILALVCLSVCYIVANYLQKLISKPIVDIAMDAELICTLRRFDQRLIPHSTDEIGQLARAFNSAVSIMNDKNQELSAAYEDIRRAHELTLKKLEEIVEEFSEPADSFLVYTHMSRKMSEGGRTRLEYQRDVMESIEDYQIRLISTSRMASIYHNAINEQRIQLGLKEYMAKYQRDLGAMIPNLHIEMLGLLQRPEQKLLLPVYKSAWDEMFRMHANLLVSMVDIVNFPVKLQCKILEGTSELSLSLVNQNVKSYGSGAPTVLSLCQLSILEDGAAYAQNTINDPEAGEEFLDDQALPRRDVKFILDSLGYIANANHITFKHYFDKNSFTIYLQLENLSCSQSQPNHLRVCQ